MTMKVRIIGDEDNFEGLTAQLFSISQTGPLPLTPLVAAAIFEDGEVVFDVTPFDLFAVRIKDEKRTYMRSGVCTLEMGHVDEDGTFTIGFVVQRVEQISLGTNLNEFTPDVPFTQQDLTVTSVGLSIVGSQIHSTGTGRYDAGFYGIHDIVFDYDFELEPRQSPFDMSAVKVKTLNTAVTGANNGFFGWLANLVVMIVASFNNGEIGKQARRAIQNEIDAAVDNTFNEMGATEGATASVQRCRINPAGITIDAWGAIPATQISCPSFLTSGSVLVRPLKQLRKMRAMRDKALRGTQRGEAYIQTIKSMSPEMVRLLILSPSLLKQADKLIRSGLADFDEADPAKGVMSKETAKNAMKFLDQLGRKASPVLRTIASNIQNDIDDFVGKPVGEVLQPQHRKR